MLALLSLFLLGLHTPTSLPEEPPVARQISSEGIQHSVIAFGADTILIDSEGRTVWNFPHNTRDGWMLPNGHILMAITRSQAYPRGAVLEVDRKGKTYFEYQGTQDEIDTVQPLPGDRILLSESGAKPRLLEIDRKGTIHVEVPLQCQLENHHMQTRMARKLRNGNYLVPHAFDKIVKEYTKEGKVVWEVRTPDWPFAVLRQQNGNTLISCTRGNLVIEVNKAGETIWKVTNEDLPNAPIKDACGAQLLPNGNIVITSYGAGGKGALKLMEITKEKKMVWSLYTGREHGIHEFQILDTSLLPLKGRSLR
jgi:hypothetical protein